MHQMIVKAKDETMSQVNEERRSGVEKTPTATVATETCSDDFLSAVLKSAGIKKEAADQEEMYIKTNPKNKFERLVNCILVLGQWIIMVTVRMKEWRDGCCNQEDAQSVTDDVTRSKDERYPKSEI